MDVISLEKQIITEKKQLTDIFFSGIKKEQKIGVEFEKIPVKTEDFTAVEFFFNNGILDFLDELKNDINAIPYFENDILLALSVSSGNVTLEPGAQVEYSLLPQNNIFDIEKMLKSYNLKTAILAEKFGIAFLGLGLQPISSFENIKVLPKKRYKFMTDYLSNRGTLPYVMMRETAGVQVSVDYSSEEDAILKLSTALKVVPFLSAFFSNSPIRRGKLSGYKSYRANAWLNTDKQRCGLISPKLFEKDLEFSFSDYADILLDVPMIFSKDKYLGDISFREYWKENSISFADWENHLSLFFPDVRLKSYIEIRNHDCQNMALNLAIPAIYKGIMYNSRKLDEINNLFADFKYIDFLFVKNSAPRLGTDFSVKNIPVIDIVKNIIDIANSGLKDFSLGEEKYLEPVYELLQTKTTPADIIINNFETVWNKDISKLIEYSKIV